MSQSDLRKSPGYRPSLSTSPSSQQHEFDILLTQPAFCKMTMCSQCYCLQKAQCGSTIFLEKSWKKVISVGSISPDKGREQLGPLSDSAFGETASAPGLLSPVPIYPSDGLDALRAPHSHKSGVVSPAVLWQLAPELQSARHITVHSRSQQPIHLIYRQQN